MKKAIFTLAIGDNPMYRAALMSFERYAGRGYTNSTLKRDTRYCNDSCDLLDGIIDAETLEETRQPGWDVSVDKAQRRYTLPRPVIDMLARKVVTIGRSGTPECPAAKPPSSISTVHRDDSPA